MNDELDRAPVYEALLLKPMVLGLPQSAFFFLLLIGAVLLVASRMNPFAILAQVIAFAICLPFLRRVFEQEPFLIDILERHLSFPEYMPHHGIETSRHWVDLVPKTTH